MEDMLIELVRSNPVLYDPTNREYRNQHTRKEAWDKIGEKLGIPAHRRMRTVTNYFLVNLSFSDLLMSLLNCIFNLIFMLDADWPFGAFYCTVNNFVANVSVASSVFTLVAISVDRYMAIVRPLKHRMSRHKARLALLIIWISSALLALPCLLYSTTKTKRFNNKTTTVCYMLWPDGNYPKSMSEHMYNLLFLVVTYLGPVVAMAICYTLMGRELWGSKSIGEQTQRQLDNIKSKRKVVRMFITVIVIFAICWLPYHGYFVYVYHNRSVAASTYIPHLYLSFYWLAMSNAMVNPIIYYWMNHRPLTEVDVSSGLAFGSSSASSEAFRIYIGKRSGKRGKHQFVDPRYD